MSLSAELLTRIEASGKVSEAALTHLRLWLGSGKLPAWAVRGLAELADAGAWAELEDRFYKGIAFGTGGMRGRTQGKVVPPSELGKVSALGTPEHPATGSAYLNSFNILRATKGLFLHLATAARPSPRLVIAHDVRHFSRNFAEEAASAWIQLGGEAFLFEGPRSTPQLSYTVRFLKADAGVVITASHNPPHDNGFKCCLATGGQVMPPDDAAIIEKVEALGIADVVDLLSAVPEKAQMVPAEAEAAYLDQIVSGILDQEVISRHTPKIVYTNIHGTGDVMIIPALRRIGIDPLVVDEQREHDPRFPTVRSPNPENPEAFTLALKLATEQGADLVLATDPDADRVGVAVPLPEGGYRLLNGNEIAALLTEFRLSSLKAVGILPSEGSASAAVVKSIVTTPLVDAICARQGVRCVGTLTGFKWIAGKAERWSARLAERAGKESLVLPLRRRAALALRHSTLFLLGLEESHGYLTDDAVRDKDANATALILCEFAATLRAKGRTLLDALDALHLCHGAYAEDLLNVTMEGASGAASIRRILKSWRTTPPLSIDGSKVVKITDFGLGTAEILDEEGEPMPREDFLVIDLADGRRAAVRASGTEPKIKFYSYARAVAADADDLLGARKRARASVLALRTWLEDDAQARTK